MGGLSEPTDLVAAIKQAVLVHQPELSVSVDERAVILQGRLVVSGPLGPFDWYSVQVIVPEGFPGKEPVVFERGNRIPKVIERHIYPSDGSCCLGVWEEWLLTEATPTFEVFLTGILHDYFLSQTYFEANGHWPFGERSHGRAGALEAFSELMDVENDARILAAYLRLISLKEVKGHHFCPCGSGKKLRQCHRSKVERLKGSISSAMARRMLVRVAPQGAVS